MFRPFVFIVEKKERHVRKKRKSLSA